MDELIQKIHDSNIYGSFIEIGAGQPLANLLFGISGASKTIYETRSYYAKESQDKLIGQTAYRSVSKGKCEAILTQYQYPLTGNDKYNTIRLGNLNSNDWLTTIGLTLTYVFGRDPCACDQ